MIKTICNFSKLNQTFSYTYNNIIYIIGIQSLSAKRCCSSLPILFNNIKLKEKNIFTLFIICGMGKISMNKQNEKKKTFTYAIVQHIYTNERYKFLVLTKFNWSKTTLTITTKYKYLTIKAPKSFTASSVFPQNFSKLLLLKMLLKLVINI